MFKIGDINFTAYLKFTHGTGTTELYVTNVTATGTWSRLLNRKYINMT